MSNDRSGTSSRADRLGGLESLFRPRSVAVLGVSDDPTKMAGNVMPVIVASGFAGAVYPVNPNRKTVGGLPALSSVLDIPDSVDLALITLPRSAVVTAIDECGRKGIAAAVIITAGFGESGQEGRQLEAELLATARKYGLRVVGPNCTGMFAGEVNLPLGTSAAFLTGRYQRGSIGLITQSGALGTAMLPRAKEQGLGCSFWFSTGNEMDVNLADLLESGATAPDTRAIALYLEAIRDAAGMTRGAQAALRSGTPIVALKVGTSPIGAERALAHTGAMIGSDAAYDGYFRQQGVLRVAKIEHLLPVAGIFDTPRSFGKRRVAVFSISGALAGHIADRFADEGVQLAELDTDTIDKLKVYGDNESAGNPYDPGAGPIRNPRLAVDAMDALLADPGVDILVVILSFAVHMFRVIPAAIEEVARRSGKAIVVIRWVPGDFQPEAFAGLEGLGVPIFNSVDECAVALGAREAYEQVRPALLTAADERAIVREPRHAPELASGLPLLETEGRTLLRRYGIEGPPEETVASAVAAAQAAERIGFPVVMKVVSRDVLHKTEIGGVVLDVRGPAEATEAYSEILANLTTKAPGSGHAGILVQAMAPSGIDVIIGAKHEAPFGPVVMVGLGGVFVEALGKVAVRPVPLARFDTEQMIDQCGLTPMLASARTGTPADREALVTALLAVSRLMQDHGDAIEELDINPLRVLVSGEGAMALDAVVVPRDKPVS